MRTASFLCAELFDALQLRAFERFVAESCNHLVLDWGELVEIALPQRAPLTQALRALNDRPVELEMHGAERLLAATRLQSSALDATDAALRLQVLRLVGDETGFTDLAVELAVASGSSPAEWVPPRFHRLDPARSGLTTLDPGAATHMQTGDADPANLQTTARLGGDLRGDDGRFARSLRAQSLRADAILVELDAVRRIDFAAATALLNWFDAQVQLGKTVELRGAHSLLVPFLRSVGLAVAD